uniref:Uncharacterized protein n=1 Tax=Arundo donax TaxID=35708 RepID=A0A0A9C349_ARUDO
MSPVINFLIRLSIISVRKFSNGSDML